MNEIRATSIYLMQFFFQQSHHDAKAFGTPANK